jgi:hypothetical protein
MDDHQTSEKLGLSDDALAVQPTVFAPDVLKDHPPSPCVLVTTVDAPEITRLSPRNWL